jgi:hypothetical protein
MICRGRARARARAGGAGRRGRGGSRIGAAMLRAAHRA